MKNLGEKEAWAYPGTAHFFGYPLLQIDMGMRIAIIPR